MMCIIAIIRGMMGVVLDSGSVVAMGSAAQGVASASASAAQVALTPASCLNPKPETVYSVALACCCCTGCQSRCGSAGCS